MSQPRAPKSIRIGGAGGFLGDSQTAAPQLLAGGRLDYMVLDYLAEVTMSLLARAQAKNPAAGFARDFTDWVWKDNMRELKARGVKLVTNAGGLDPQGCRARVEALAAEAGLSFKIATVDGDDLRGRVGELAGEREMFKGETYPPADKVLTANAYFGARAIRGAGRRGRRGDHRPGGGHGHRAGAAGARVRLGVGRLRPAGPGLAAGHVLECGAQATGGLFTDWEEVPDWAHIGYPIAECYADGSFVVSKPAGTGGLCSPATIAEQILYEVGDPLAYLLPDVTCDFSHVTVEAVGEQMVRVTGARGRAPSGKYKVCTTYQDGWRCIALMPVVGRDAARKAERQARAVIERVEELLRARNLAPFRSVRIEALGAEATYGAQARARDTREVICKTGIEHEDPAAITLYMRESESPTTSMSVGSTGWFGARPSAAPVVRVFSTLIDRDAAPPRVILEGREIALAGAPLASAAPEPAPIPAGESPVVGPGGVRVPLIDLAWARSGDKGDAFNIGVIARRPEYLPYIRAALPEARVQAFFEHEFEGAERPSVTRYEVPGLKALNFHLKESLGGGQMASLRLDALAKGKAQQLLDIEVEIPATLRP
jgi:hypothetical protein